MDSANNLYEIIKEQCLPFMEEDEFQNICRRMGWGIEFFEKPDSMDSDDFVDMRVGDVTEILWK